MLSTDSRTSKLEHLRSLSHLLDNVLAIPGTRFRIGLDPIIGLIPGLGDVSGIVFSAYIVAQAARWKLPAGTLLRMMINIVLDWLVGNVPMVGDLFDAGFKANSRNVALLENHLEQPGEHKAADRWVLILVFFVLGLLLAISLAIASTVIWALVQLMGWAG